ncbi:MAG: SMR family transporter [Candidatus Zambryskibacteria bacterium]|nr:SMR family transporter [Candidatus Zambryskibacteria bacterium]
MAYIYLICAFILNASGNIFLKLGSRQGLNFSSFVPTVFLFSNWQFVLGCVLFVLNVPLYFLALRNIELSTAYPIMVGMSFLIVNSTAFFLFKESVSVLQILGYVCMVVGIILVVAYGRP